MRRTAICSLIVCLLPVTAVAQEAGPSVQVRAHGREMVITVGNLTIAPATPYDHHPAEAYHVIQWPSTGWVTGYEIELLDSTGAVLPRAMLHHAGIANVDRRQIAYPMAERMFAAAHETKPVRLPDGFGVQIAEQQRLVLYYALVNPRKDSVAGATLRVRLRWASARAGLTTVLPFYASAKDDTRESISFDIPAGRSETSAEFSLPSSGWLRALGGHLHDYGVELRLEDAESNKVLARVTSRRTSDGRLRAMSRTMFPFKRNGLRLDATRRYRVVAVYDNPTGKAIKGGAMGFLAGAFTPRDISAFESVALSDERFVRDVEKLTSQRRASVAQAHAHH